MGLAVPCELQPDRWYLSWWEPLDLQGGEFKLCPWKWAKDKARASLAPVGFPWTRKRLKIRGKTREAKSEMIIYWVLCCWTHYEVGLVLLVLKMRKWRTRVWSDQLAEGHRANYDQVCLLPCSPIGHSRLSRNTPMWQELILLSSPFYRWETWGSEEGCDDQSLFLDRSWSCGPWVGQPELKSTDQVSWLRWWPASCSEWAQLSKRLEGSKGSNCNPWF